MQQSSQLIHCQKDFNSTCRLCTTDFALEDLSEFFFDTVDSTESKIRNVVSVKVGCGGGCVSTICKKCIKELNATMKFIGDSLATNASLQKVVTFISECSVPDKPVQSITENTLALFELIGGNLGNMSSLCRLCKTQHKQCDMLKIFGTQDNLFAMQIRSLIHLKLNQGDGLPDSVCNVCIDKLHVARTFIKKNVANYDLLQHILYQDLEVERRIKQEADFKLDTPVKEEPLETDDADDIDMAVSFSHWLGSAALTLNEEKPSELQTRLPAEEKLGNQQPGGSTPPSVPEDGSHSCNVCSKIFTSREQLFEHSQQHIETRPTFDCDVCVKKYKKKKYLVQHKKIHTGELPSCKVCQKVFSRQSTLKLHSRVHTGTRQTYDCNVCKKNFCREYKLREHMRIHTGERLYSCKNCQETFAQRYQLGNHKRRQHGTELAVVCNVCKKRLSSRNSLIKHMRIHTGERPYPCEICKKTFPRRDSLLAHARVHGDKIKSHVCDVCNKKLSSRRTLVQHKLIHIRVRP